VSGGEPPAAATRAPRPDPAGGAPGAPGAAGAPRPGEAGPPPAPGLAARLARPGRDALRGVHAGLGRGDRLRTPVGLIQGVALVLLIALAWSLLAEVDRVVRATGRMIPSDRAQVLQHLEGGIVADILVREGQIVERGAELVLISDVQAQSQLGERNVRLNALRAQMARLEAEAQGQAGRARESGAMNPDVERELLVLAARRDKMDQTIRVLREQLEQRRQEIREAETRKRGLVKEHAIATQQLAVVNDMVGRQAASRLELLEAQSRVERFATQMQEVDASIPRTAAAIRELEGKIAEASAQFRSEARTRLAEVQVEADRLEEEINAGKDRLKRTAVRSPVRGVVNRIYTTTIGGVVRAGDAVVEITPLGDRLTIEASIAPQDRAEVNPGLPSVVRVSAYDYAVYGTLQGQVSEVSADTLADEKGLRYYRVRIEVDADSYARFGRELTPGMTVTADVVLGARTVFRYLVSPLTRAFDSAFKDRK
jgi:adhesin transport system membrane fusion protein